MEEEFVTNQERLKPQEERIEEDRTQVGPVVQIAHKGKHQFRRQPEKSSCNCRWTSFEACP